jgi:hypothetical protein
MSDTVAVHEDVARKPVATLRRIASKLRKSADWEDVFGPVIRERIAAARRSAEHLEGENPRYAVAKKLAGKALLATLVILVARDVAELAFGDKAFDFGFWSFLGGTLIYLLIAGMSYLLVLVVTYWYFIVKYLGLPRWSSVVRCFVFDSSVELLRVLVLLPLFFLALWVFTGFNTAILTLALIALSFLVFLVGSEGRPIQVCLIGAMTQGSLELGFRLQQRFLPGRVVSCLETGLRGRLGGIFIDGSDTRVEIEKLQDKVMKAAALSTIIVIDARKGTTGLPRLIDTLQLYGLSARPYVLYRDELEDDWLTHQVRLTIDGLFVTEKELLEVLWPKWWQPCHNRKHENHGRP